MVVLAIQSLHWYVHVGFMEKKKKHLMCTVRATQRDDSSSQRFEIDRDKAREALKQLDQQIESQADEKPRTIVKSSSSTSSGGSSMDPFMFEEPPEMSGSFLTTSAFLLLAFTLFYNVLFFTVIKPSMDGQESVPSDKSVAMSDSDIVQFPLMSFPENTFKQ